MKKPDPKTYRSQLDSTLGAFRTAFKRAFALEEISLQTEKTPGPESIKKLTRQINAFLESRAAAGTAFLLVRTSIQALTGRKAAFELVWDYLNAKYVAIIIGCDVVRFGEPPLLPIRVESVASHWPELRGHLILPIPKMDRARYLKLCQRIEDECNKAKTGLGK